MQNLTHDPFGIVGQVLDSQFRVDRLVGEGGFSAVYRGFHLGLQEPIAIKCLKLPPSLSPSLVEQFEKRFRDESRILYRLSQGNLNIVRSIAGGTWQAPQGFVVPFMILEWMEGRSLANEFTIRRTVGNQGRTVQDLVKVFASAADGLGYAHSQGVVHRDLNPGNLFLANTPQGVKMKVLDFGVAKILDDATLNIGPRTQTVGAIRIFAPAYGAPEQFDDAIGKVGASSDVYAFALILMEALRDRCVNDGQHLGEFATKAIDPANRPTPRRLGIDVSDEVEQIFARATKLDPRERWQTAGELWHALTIAVNTASQERHQQAAFETPSLGMPNAGKRATQKGMAPPPASGGTGGGAPSGAVPAPAKHPGTARMEKTLPINAVMPQIPGLPRPSPPSPAAGRPPSVPNVPVAAAPPRYGDANEETRIAPPLAQTAAAGSAVGMIAENEDEVTRVRAPEPEMLRELAEAEARKKNNPGNTTMTQLSPTPRPAAGAAPAPPIPAAGMPPPPANANANANPGGVEPVPPSFGGTMMMAPGVGVGPQNKAGGTQPPPPQNRPPAGGQLAKTMPLTGPHPLGQQVAQMHSQQQPQQQQPPQAQQQQPPPPQHQQHSPQTHLMPQMQMQQPPPQQQPQQPQQQQQQQQPMMPAHFQQPQQGAPPNAMGNQRLGESVSLPPQSIAGVPKKNNLGIIIGAVIGGAVLIGIIVAVVVFARAKSIDTGPDAMASSSVSAAPSIATAPPPPTETAEPPPPPTEEDAGAAVVVDDDTAADAGGAAVNTNPNPTPTNTNTNPNPNPTPTPTETTAPAVKDAGPPPDPNAFNEAQARSKLTQANGVLVFCKKEGGLTGLGTANVTFGTDGSVTEVKMDPPFAGTPAGDCVAGQFKRAGKINSFQGAPVTVRHAFEVPK